MLNNNDTYNQVDVNNPETKFQNDNSIKIMYSMLQYKESLIKEGDVQIDRGNVIIDAEKITQL